jgi:hemoglobin
MPAGKDAPQHDGRVLIVADRGIRDAERLSPADVAAKVDDFYTSIGGAGFFNRLARQFYALVADDDLLAPLFPPDDWDRQARRLAAHYIALYGRNDLTAAWDPRLHRAHAQAVITRDQRKRWLDLMGEAGRRLAAPEPQFSEFMTIMKIASGEMMAVSRGAAIARGERFNWDGSPR